MIFFHIGLVILLLASFLCLFRIASGPTPPDRTVAIDILGTVIVGISCLYAIITEQEYYINVAIAWALLSFIGTVALAKYLEGRRFDE